MTEKLFYLGREPLLSLAELRSYLDAEGIGGTVRRVADHVAAVDANSEFDPRFVLGRLGGTVRVAEPLETVPAFPEDPEELGRALTPHLLAAARDAGSKVTFGLSLYPSAGTPRIDLKRAAGAAKEILSEEGMSSRYVLPLRGTALSAAQTAENDLDRDGIEFLVTDVDGGLLLARTLAVQAVTEEARRDMKKPGRRLREGLLPPKIARIMVNLARREGSASILDPFCGSGVLLMEAARLGLKPIGADSSERALGSARENLDWLLERGEFPPPGKYELHHVDARDLSTKLPPLSIDAAATEPFLGPPLHGPLPDDKAETLSVELHDLYVRALAEIRILLRPGARCVFVLPVFRTRSGRRAVEVRKDLPFIGFREYNPLAGCEGVPGEGRLEHSRPGQNVTRTLLILENVPGDGFGNGNAR